VTAVISPLKPWQSSELDSLVDLVTEGIEPSEAPDLPYVGLEHIDSGRLSLHHMGDSSEVYSRKTLFQSNDVLYGKLRPYLDKIALAGLRGMCSTDILVLRPRTHVDPMFLTAVLHTPDFLRHAVATTTGANHPRTSWAAIKRYEVALPQLDEQRAIAHVLWTVQRAREATEQVITAARELKQSLMRHLFTYGLVPVGSEHDVETTADEANTVPAHWESQQVKDVAEVMASTTSPTAVGSADLDVNGQTVLFLKVSDLARADGQGFIRLAASALSVTPGKAASMKLVPPQAVVFPKRGAAISTNRKRRVTLPAMLDPNLIAVTPHDIDPGFLYRWFEALDLTTLVDPATLPQLNKKDIGPLPIRVPPTRREQKEIGTVLDTVDRKIAAEEQRCDALDILFKCLLHDLMSARLRIAEDLIERVA